MLLTESEGKSLLVEQGLPVPVSVLVKAGESVDLSKVTFPSYVKAQVLYGNRALQGLVKKAESTTAAEQIISQFFQQTDANNQPITQVLVESGVAYEQAYYLSISYDTRRRAPVIKFSTEGGAGMDDRGHTLQSVYPSIEKGVIEFPPEPSALKVVQHLFNAFLKLDAVLLEINPLVRTKSGEWFCLDAKIELEETASYRHPEWATFPTRSDLGRPPTEREEQAHANSRSDHRGVAGESFFEFAGGTIGVMASGGGASTLAMDALMAEGLKPANYTEYSGNPTREKVAGLARVVLSIPNLEALYVVGSNANFTDILDTLSGVIDGFLESPYADQPGFVLLVRRGGPRWQEAFEMVKDRLKDKPTRLKLLGPDFPLVETAAELQKMLENPDAS